MGGGGHFAKGLKMMMTLYVSAQPPGVRHYEIPPRLFSQPIRAHPALMRESSTQPPAKCCPD